MSTVIKVENISKQYRLGDVGTGALSHDLKRWWYKARGKEDPYLQVGETNDRSSKGNSEYVWALKDINFEVKAGEVLGIIGRNGAGKSTLLKILSKTTTPTTGNIKVRGRIASLLEVGTGFHPELTGRENIYLNGAILGMTKREIQKKFDEIVDFSGVERYIDTPVKRYSSGMYVRLAFAVAAHLEPEILIVDEVLAVGDAEFQKKCLGKMKDVSVNEGRTVLFVSHNMAAVQSLCTDALVLNNGMVFFQKGSTVQALQIFKNSISVQSLSSDLSVAQARSGSGNLVITSMVFKNENDEIIVSPSTGEKILIELEVKALVDIKSLSIAIGFYSQLGECKLILWNELLNSFFDINRGIALICCVVDKFPLTVGFYTINLITLSHNEILDWIQEAKSVEVLRGDYYNTGKTIESPHQTALIHHKWEKLI